MKKIAGASLANAQRYLAPRIGANYFRQNYAWPLVRRVVMRAALLFASLMLTACATLLTSKPVMPLADGLYIYRTAATSAPTILLVPGCGGMTTNGSREFYPRLAKLLNAKGFNTVILDYVTIMGQDNACLAQVKFSALQTLINEALVYTAQQPFADRQPISLLGWSLGGSAVLAVAANDAQDRSTPINAVAAYYPGCYAGLSLSSHPTLLLLGLADNVVNPNDCMALASHYPQAPLQIKTYAGAQHSFDIAEFKTPQSTWILWKKFTSEYHEQAANDALQVLLQFFKDNGRTNVSY